MKRRRLIGTVVSDAPDQTVIVKVARRKIHPLYRKAYNVSKKFAAHDAKNAYKVGAVVTIEETKPLSATKRFQVIGEAGAQIEPVKQAKAPAKPQAAEKADQAEQQAGEATEADGKHDKEDTS